MSFRAIVPFLALILTLFGSEQCVYAETQKCKLLLLASNRNELAINRAETLGLNHIKSYAPGYSRKVIMTKNPEQKYVIKYFYINGKPITTEKLIARLNDLAVPPSHTDVWISTDPLSHIQATSRDSNGKQQYFYHSRWEALTKKLKFERMQRFGAALPDFRKKTNADLKQSEISKTKISALLSRLLEVVLIRIGNSESATESESFGLTTMLKSHVIETSPLTLEFNGKSDQLHTKIISDPDLAKITRSLLNLPGKNLFQYLDENGNPQSISAEDINQYIKENMGEEFSAKDFRTWMATVYATEYLYQAEYPSTDEEMKSTLQLATEYAADFLGNTASVCRQSYIHPRIFEIYQNTKLYEKFLNKKIQNRGKYFSKIESLVLELIN